MYNSLNDIFDLSGVKEQIITAKKSYIITTDLIKYLFYVSGKCSDLIVSYAYSLPF